ncbi:2-amino-4-hydroxy-6-hydroxymethyldihydropteridine diphosphokinase [Balneolaceae bacterium ANBcel3]|nr:2-amino-4-hydroxy-6-hydroxymethyldihydropteridine diphosphokinase [Balneolaceae bacterium ANBcel3]
MAQVIIALGSNVGDRLTHMSRAKAFLASLSQRPVFASSIYETEPVGEASTHYYYNAVCEIHIETEAQTFLKELKSYEREHGRDPDALRWANRTIDLDIIDFDHTPLEATSLILPHPEYPSRLFVLEPLKELYPNWIDPVTGQSVSEMISKAPKIEVYKTALKW